MPHTHLLHRKEKEQSILTSCKVLSLLMFDTTYFAFFISCIHLKPHLAARGAEVCSSSIIKAGTWPSAPIHPAHIIRSTDKCSIYAHASVQFSEDQWDVNRDVCKRRETKQINAKKQSGSLQEHENPGPGGNHSMNRSRTQASRRAGMSHSPSRTPRVSRDQTAHKSHRQRKSLRNETWGRRREESVNSADCLHNGQPPTCSPTSRLQHTAQSARKRASKRLREGASRRRREGSVPFQLGNHSLQHAHLQHGCITRSSDWVLAVTAETQGGVVWGQIL